MKSTIPKAQELTEKLIQYKSSYLYTAKAFTNPLRFFTQPFMRTERRRKF